MARRLTIGSRGVGPMVAYTVCSAFLVPPTKFHSRTRSIARVARARQVAIYLAHVGFGLSYAEAGRLFGRDRTTAAYACRLIEDRRDDPRFDASLDCLEHTLRARLLGVVGTVEA
jgi:chromosomal replication initiation ATPase DnaA